MSIKKLLEDARVALHVLKTQGETVQKKKYGGA